MAELRLSTNEILYMIMAWDAMKREQPTAYKRHIGVATMTRLRLEAALDAERKETAD